MPTPSLLQLDDTVSATQTALFGAHPYLARHTWPPYERGVPQSPSLTKSLTASTLPPTVLPEFPWPPPIANMCDTTGVASTSVTGVTCEGPGQANAHRDPTQNLNFDGVPGSFHRPEA